ncbi:MAG TPA: hypothetical protein VD928_03755, partial [Candidatus Paceibacterota bacterium]|nr:hypothetical protein [Candidatus Paceibacterota bacterium]
VPLILGLAGGSGAFLSNSIFYFLVLHGKRALPDRWERRIEELTKIIKKLPLWAVWIVVFVYSGLTPFPDDILIAALALSSISYLRVAPVLLAANITIVTLISYFAGRGILLF